MKVPLILLIFISAGLFNSGCIENDPVRSTDAKSVGLEDSWGDYWYTGKAEVNSYQLVQARYNEKRLGHSILIFVTEDFSKSKQVKLDNSNRNPNDKVSVLKTNILRKFNTGIYDYSMMASVFTPVSLDKYPHTLKITMSSQEWCGQTFTQINRAKDTYNISSRSYFESEGDEISKLKADWLEDELWNRIRINPDKMPMGDIDIIPGTFYARFSHNPLKVQKATITKQKNLDSTTFQVLYTSIDRRLLITVENDLPYRILNWEEIHDGNRTSGNLMQTLHIPYWQMNGNEFETYRDSLLIN